jgi:hypothetical protein
MRASHKTTNTPHLTHTLRHHNPHGGSSQPDGCNTRRHGGEKMRDGHSSQHPSIHPHANSVSLALLLCNHTNTGETSGRVDDTGRVVLLLFCSMFQPPRAKGAQGAR